MKYEMIFGDPSLFDNAPLGTELVGHSGGFYKNSPDGPIYCGGCTFTTDEYRNIGFIAARRVIRTPTWTVEDQKAGRLPDVGCMVMVTSVDECASVAAINNDAVCVVFHDGEFTTLHKSGISPIETPEEKAERLRSEWINDAINAVQKTDNAGGYEAIYDALLSGELPVPTKGG